MFRAHTATHAGEPVYKTKANAHEKYFPSATFPRYLSSIPVKMFGMSNARTDILVFIFRKFTREKVRNSRNYVKARDYKRSKNVLCEILRFSCQSIWLREYSLPPGTSSGTTFLASRPLTDDTITKHRGHKVQNSGAFRTQICAPGYYEAKVATRRLHKFTPDKGEGEDSYARAQIPRGH